MLIATRPLVDGEKQGSKGFIKIAPCPKKKRMVGGSPGQDRSMETLRLVDRPELRAGCSPPWGRPDQHQEVTGQLGLLSASVWLQGHDEAEHKPGVSSRDRKKVSSG